MLNEYTIEYAEDLHMRDSVLLATRKVSLMRYIPETKKILVISEDADNILVMKEDFTVLSKGVLSASECLYTCLIFKNVTIHFCAVT